MFSFASFLRLLFTIICLGVSLRIGLIFTGYLDFEEVILRVKGVVSNLQRFGWDSGWGSDEPKVYLKETRRIYCAATSKSARQTES
ncbi:hypothetical protein BZA77DRAFT_315022 [Pyronema omphalodes]|nr:hypothetical protein BZA77DRAFT_315022 [Pyronema omphalodes]